MKRSSYTSLAVRIKDAAFIQAFRKQHIFTPAAALPPHVTVHAPFMYAGNIDQNVLSDLRRIVNNHPKFEFTLHKLARFEDIGVLYLIPEPAHPFHVLRQAIMSHFPYPPPDFETPIMHVTIARNENKSELDDIEDEFLQDYGAQLPYKTRATEVCLYEKCNGVWHQHSTFALSD